MYKGNYCEHTSKQKKQRVSLKKIIQTIKYSKKKINFAT